MRWEPGGFDKQGDGQCILSRGRRERERQGWRQLFLWLGLQRRVSASGEVMK